MDEHVSSTLWSLILPLLQLCPSTALRRDLLKGVMVNQSAAQASDGIVSHHKLHDSHKEENQSPRHEFGVTMRRRPPRFLC